MPQISIITVNYNDATGLERTIKSVQEQTVTDYEHIIIDGNSTDGSKEIILQHQDGFSYWVSEPDNGIYNAMNKGIVRAKGEYLLFLNSGDFLINGEVLSNVIPELKSGEDFVCGDLLLDIPLEPYRKKHPIKLTMSYLMRQSFGHSSSFIKKHTFDRYGFYDETLKIVSDWKHFFVSLALNGATYKSIPLIISIFDMNGISSDRVNINLMEKEKQIVLDHYLKYVFNNSMDTYIFSHFKTKPKPFLYLMAIRKSPALNEIAKIILRPLKILNKLFISENLSK